MSRRVLYKPENNARLSFVLVSTKEIPLRSLVKKLKSRAESSPTMTEEIPSEPNLFIFTINTVSM